MATSTDGHGRSKSGRTARGTFTRGNKIGRGAVTSATRAQRLTALLSVVTAADWDAVCAAAVKQARHGDWRARQWLSAYLLPAADAAAAADGDAVQLQVFSHGTFVDALSGRPAQPFDYMAAVDAIAYRGPVRTDAD